MSFIYHLHEKNDIFEPEVETSVRYGDLKKNFEIYRSNAEQTDAKYREAKQVIDRLKEELNTSREMEKSQRLRISSLQSRITVFEGKWKKLYELSEQHRNNSVKIQKIDSNIINITKLFQELKEKFQTVITQTMREVDVIKEKNELQSILEVKEIELQQMRNEINSALCEKEELVKKYETENEKLREEIEILKSQSNDTKDHFGSMISTYQQQILEYMTIIEKMEKERKSILGDYETGSTLQEETKSTGCRINDRAVTWPDSTVTCLTEEREKLQPGSTDLNVRDRSQGQSHPEPKPSPLPQKNQDRRMTCQFSKFSYKQKPKLQFLDGTSEISAACYQPQKPKKRLYSQNSNHYIN